MSRQAFIAGLAAAVLFVLPSFGLRFGFQFFRNFPSGMKMNAVAAFSIAKSSLVKDVAVSMIVGLAVIFRPRRRALYVPLACLAIALGWFLMAGAILASRLGHEMHTPIVQELANNWFLVLPWTFASLLVLTLESRFEVRYATA